VRPLPEDSQRELIDYVHDGDVSLLGHLQDMLNMLEHHKATPSMKVAWTAEYLALLLARYHGCVVIQEFR